MSVKRLAIPLCAVIALLALAGALEIVVVLLSSGTEAVAAEGKAAASATPVVSQVKTAVVFEQRAEKARQTEFAVSAHGLADPGFIQVDGVAIDVPYAEEIVRAAGGFAEHVQYIDQNAVLPSGCELVALAVALNAEGVEVEPTDLVSHLHIGSNVATDYLGDPARNGGGLPPAVVEAANAWAKEHGEKARALNLTGTTFDGVLALTSLGYPVITWTTEGLQEPYFTGTVQDGLQWYRPEHCVVVYGTDGDDVLVSDSLEGLTRRSLTQFAHVYEACGNKAILIQP